MSKPLLVITGDCHFTLHSLEIASKVLIQAFELAKGNQIPLLINGDLVDGKSILRGEVVNRLIQIFKTYQGEVLTYVSTGNHDLLSEKDDTCSALEFLSYYCSMLIRWPVKIPYTNIGVIPYRNTNERFLESVSEFSKDTLLCVHQGLQGANMSHYVKDDSSAPKDLLDGRRIIASHYHMYQDIPLPNGGLWTYVGSPYSTSFSEAFDPPKCIGLLFDDGTLKSIPTNLRKHVIIETNTDDIDFMIQESYQAGFLPNPEDLVWVKLSGKPSELAEVSKKDIGEKLLGHSNYRLELLPTEQEARVQEHFKNLSGMDILDRVIEDLNETIEQKMKLKQLWREVI